MSAGNDEQTAASKLKVAGVVSFYMVAALVMVFVNKAVLNSTPDLPFSFLTIQLIIAILLLHLASFIASTPAGKFLPSKFALPELDFQVAKKLTPLITIGVVGLIFNTLCLRNVEASFFQIARGLLLPLTIAVSAIHTRVIPRAPVLRAAFVTSAGFFLGVSPSSYFSSSSPAALEVTAVSLLYGFLSSLMIAVHAVLVKSAQEYVDNSVIKLTYWTNLISAGVLVPCLVLNGEVAVFMERMMRGGEEWKMFLVGSAVTGVFGFFLCMAGLLSIKVTSPVTHMFSSAARSVIQTILGVLIFNDVITPNRASSIAVITAGTVYFTWLKSGRSFAPAPPLPAEKDLEKQEKE